jgi:predicted O-methyltransferase YrrM
MTELIDQKAEAYAASLTTPTEQLLQEIEKFTYTEHPQAVMLSGPVQGKFLELVSRMIKPRRILEVGTFLGYSALCLAAGLTADGMLHTLDINEADASRAKAYFTKSSLNDKILLHLGSALEIIGDLDEEWDLAFIDADKVNYINYYELILPRLKKGGFILADNVLFHGEVLEEKITGKNAKAIDAFNKHVAADERVQQVMVTMRDGLMVICKK